MHYLRPPFSCILQDQKLHQKNIDLAATICVQYTTFFAESKYPLEEFMTGMRHIKEMGTRFK